MKTNLITGLGPLLLVPLSAAVVSAPAITTLLKMVEQVGEMKGPVSFQLLASAMCVTVLAAVLVVSDRQGAKKKRTEEKIKVGT